MKTIYKYPLRHVGSQELEMPQGAQILSCQAQQGVPCVWALVTTESPKVNRVFRVLLTGAHADPLLTAVHIGTVLLDEGNFVVHVFDEGER